RMNVKFMRLQFTDILGVIKNVEIPDRQFAAALDGAIMFDGSSIEGFVRIEESDMYLRPDLSTFRILPWTQGTGERIARLICDIYNPDGTPFAGCPRHTLKRGIAGAADSGFVMNAGPEAEFFLFQTRDGSPTTESHDAAGYFDRAPGGLGEGGRGRLLRSRGGRSRRRRAPPDRPRPRDNGPRGRSRASRSRVRPARDRL